MGESHICGGCDQCGDLCITDTQCREFTTRVVNALINYKQGDGAFESWLNTFTRFVNILHNEQVDAETFIDFLQSVVFYNYVQSSTDALRVSPSEQEFADSETAFFEVLKKYKPDLIIVWGTRLWDRLPQNGEWADFDILDGANGKFYYYQVDNKKMPAYSIYHPSSSAGEFLYFIHEYSLFSLSDMLCVKEINCNVNDVLYKCVVKQ
ncbi:MAG: uracil-DNA glycosylase family protein [Prevotellaceae bacterium]|nr:uracil-DNA glycosylase family protein [Prevotellaceae bacterium]